MFSSEPHDFGYSAPSVPEPFSIWVEGQAHRLSSFKCLRAPSSSSALATAFQAQLSVNQPIVVKLGDRRLITHAVGNSDALHVVYGKVKVIRTEVWNKETLSRQRRPMRSSACSREATLNQTESLNIVYGLA